MQLASDRLDERQPPWVDDERGCSAIGEDVGVVARRQERGQSDRHRADPDRAEERGYERGRVRKDQRDAVLRPEAQQSQAVAGPVGGTSKVRVRKGSSFGADRRTIGATGFQLRVDERDGQVEGVSVR
jgi:hypothetical protein